MSGKLNKKIGLSLLPFGFIFLFEPGYTILDPLPDFIGYFIICIAIMNLADINDRISDALSGFRKGIIISILRCLSVYLLHKYFSETELSVGLTLFTFVFAFFELIVLIPAFRQLFEGLLALGMHHDGTAVYLKKLKRKEKIDPNDGSVTVIVKESRRNATEMAYSLTATFIFIKAAAMSLPEMTSLISNSSYEFIKIVRGIGIVICIPFGIVWLVNMLVYFARLRKDSPFIRGLSELYLQNASDNPNFYKVRDISAIIYTLIVAFILSVDFYSEYQNMLPDVAFYVVLIVASLLCRKYSKKWGALLGVSILGSGLNIASYLLSTEFHSKFYPAAIKKNLEAYNLFYTVVTLYAIEALIFLVTVTLVLLIFWDIFKLHSDYAIVTTQKESSEHKSRFMRGTISTALTALLTAAGSVYFILSQPFYNTEMWYFYYSSIISVFVSIVFAFFAAYFAGFINNSVKYRYRMDI